MIKIKAFHFSTCNIDLDLFYKYFPNLCVSEQNVCGGTLVIVSDFKISRNDTEFFIGRYEDNDLQYGLQISIISDKIIFKTDWLGTVPLYLDKNSNSIASSWVGFVNNKYELDEEGFREYALRGYCPGVKTAYKNLSLVRHSSVVTFSDGVYLTEIKEVEMDLMGDKSYESVLQRLQLAVNLENNDLIVPLSGGLDSRLLVGLLNNKNASCWTYSVSKIPGKGIEEVIAKDTASKLGYDWNLLTPENYLEHIEMVGGLYGPIMHYHGMYQFDFYSRLSKSKTGIVLSGIFGDIFARLWSDIWIKSWEDISEFSYSHGRSISPKYLKNLDNFNQNRFISSRQHSIELIREKMSLIGYLRSLPEYIGRFSVYCPFLIREVAMDIIRLPDSDKLNRKWQKRALSSLGIENNKLRYRRENYLAIREELFFIPDEPKNLEKLKDVIQPECIRMIQDLKDICLVDRMYYLLSSNYFISRLLKKLGYINRRMESLNMYFVLAPILKNLK